MGRIRRGGYVFFTAKGDHRPRHVHIYRDGVMVAKFDLEGWEVMAGTIDRRLRRMLEQLREERRL